MKWLKKTVLDNFGLKVLALAISLGLWILYTREPFAEVAYNVPIAFVNVPAGQAVAGDTPAAVHVVIRGRLGLLRRVAANDLNFSIDLAHVAGGSEPLRVTRQMVHVPYGTEVVEVTPPKFRVVLVTNTSPVPDAE
jgi:hypothetical protein